MRPLGTGLLDVGDGHRLWWRTVGDPAGVPVVFLHGGPGSGTGDHVGAWFGEGLLGVLLDQRGCGRSTPSAGAPDADLTANTTRHLVADLERLRMHLGIERWAVAGMSWGTALGLVYAQAHPDRVSALVLAAVTAGTRREVEWITRDMGRVFPREWAAFAAPVPESERSGNLAAAYARLLAHPDHERRAAAARAWCTWEDVHVSLAPGWAPSPRFEDPAFRLTFARLVTHYWAHDHFLEPGQVERDLPRIAHLPATLIHGRHDVSSPLDTAWRLHLGWPGSRLVVLDDAGHGGGGMTEAIVGALQRLR